MLLPPDEDGEESSARRVRTRRVPVAELVVYSVSCRAMPIDAEVDPAGRLVY
jgi:hypothetical protein